MVNQRECGSKRPWDKQRITELWQWMSMAGTIQNKRQDLGLDDAMKKTFTLRIRGFNGTLIVAI